VLDVHTAIAGRRAEHSGIPAVFPLKTPARWDPSHCVCCLRRLPFGRSRWRRSKTLTRPIPGCWASLSGDSRWNQSC